MFLNGAEMIAHGDFSSNKNDCVFFYQFDEGTGDTITDQVTSSTKGGQNDGAWQTRGSQGAAWAGAGTFDGSDVAHVLKMTGAGTSLNYLSGEVLGNVNIANSSGTVTANSITGFTDATCDTTISDATVTCNANTSIKVGQSVHGTGIPFGATVASVNAVSVTSFELSAVATATNANTTLSFNNDLTLSSIDTETNSSFTAPSGILTLNHEYGGDVINGDGHWVHSNGTVEITTPEWTYLDASFQSGNLYNLIINHADSVVRIVDPTVIANDLTVTLGRLSEDNASVDTLEVTGDVTIANGGILGNNTWTGNLSFGSLTIESGGEYKATSGTTTLTADNGASPKYCFKNAGTFTPNAGLVMVESPNTYVLMEGGGIHDLTIAAETHNTAGIYWNTNPFVITGVLTIEALGYFAPWASGHGLTVTEDVSVSGILGSGSTGAYSFGSLSIASGGTYNATSDTTSLTSGASAGTWVLQNGGTFTHNNGTIKVTSTEGSCHIQSNTFYNVTVAMGDSTDATKWRDAGGNTTTILGDLVIEEGMFKRDSNGDDLIVHGLVDVQSGGTFGTASESGDNTFNSLTIGSAGTYNSTSASTTIAGNLINNGGNIY